MENTWVLWSIIAGCVALGVWLESKYKWAAKVSALVIILLLSILLSNVGLIPTEAAVYDTVWDYFVPLSLPLLLFRADLRKICKESGQMLVAFLIGALGTVVGAMLSFLIFKNLIPELAGLAAMMTGTYTGGSVNFAALSVVFGVSGNMVSAATIADNLNMAIYFFVLLSIPVRCKTISGEEVKEKKEKKDFSLKGLSFGMGAAVIIVTLSALIATLMGDVIPASNVGLEMLNSLLGSKYLWITTISVICATAFPKVFGNITGLQEIGTFFIYCFIFVIGAPASIGEIVRNSPLLLVFALLIVAFNMIFTFAGGKILKMDRQMLIIASNANVGGPTTAASMAIAKGWDDLVGPALLIGSLGYIIGNYLGMMVGYICSAI